MGNETLLEERQLIVQSAVMTLLQQVDLPILLSMVAGGRDQFVSHAKRHWVGHGFTDAEFRDAFRLVEDRAVELTPMERQ
tara:strand:+ start:190 stop:429 length:240 start_codon:yes stop_codon:yes gene_type:complete